MTVADIYAKIDPKNRDRGDACFFSFKSKDGALKVGCRTNLWFMPLQEYTELCECEVLKEYLSRDERIAILAL